jgi:hypothetical protein
MDPHPQQAVSENTIMTESTQDSGHLQSMCSLCGHKCGRVLLILRALKVEAKFLNEIQTKVLRVSTMSQSPLQLCLEISISSTHAASYSFYSSINGHCKGERRKT